MHASPPKYWQITAHRILLSGLILLLSGCGLFDDDTPNFPSPLSCQEADYNQYVYDVMKRFYYWYEHVDPDNQVNPKDTTLYPTPQSLINALKYDPLDRFSSVRPASSFNQLFNEGEFIGVGLRLLTNEAGQLMVAYAMDGSPAANAGIERGDRLVTINDYSADNLSGDDWTAAWGPSETGVVVNLTIEKPNGDIVDETVSKAVVTINTTQHSAIINDGDNVIGYLHFTHFLNSLSVNALNNQIENFNANNVNELIIDLRYNGGGSVQTARHLGNLVAGNKTPGSIFSRLVYNNKSDGYDGYSESYNFSEIDNGLAVNRVFFITTGASCSASEMLINALVPNNGVEVIVVGSGSCGKPVGSRVDNECGKSLTVINFETRNDDNQGGYFDGISAGYPGLSAFCEAADDVNNPLGNINEASIAAALNYMNTSQCSAVKSIGRTKHRLTRPVPQNPVLEGMI